MIPYLILFAIAGLPALFYWNRQSKLVWGIAWGLFVLFIGLRHEVGGDWASYLMITESLSNKGLMEAMQEHEALYSLLTWCSAQMGFGVYGANLVGAIIFCTGLFTFCAKLPNRWLALAAATPFLTVVAVMSANRQGMAIGVVLFLMANWRETGLLKRSIGIIVAGMFHTSALSLLVLTVVDLRISKFKKVVLLVVTASVGLWLMSRSDAAWYRYTTIYVDQSDGAYSSGAVFHLLLNLIPALLMLSSKRYWARLTDRWPLLSQLCWMSIALLMLLPFFTVAVGRMSLYLFPVSITFFAYLPTLAKAGAAGAIVRTVSVVAQAGVLSLWLQYANTAFTYMPYQNVLMTRSSELELPR